MNKYVHWFSVACDGGDDEESMMEESQMKSTGEAMIIAAVS